MTSKLTFEFEGDRLIIKGLPSHLQLRGIKYPSKSISELKHLSVASSNMTAAKFYMDSIKSATKETDPHMYDGALLAAVIKYAGVFKPDRKGRVIDAEQIFTTSIVIVNKSLRAEAIAFDDPDREFLKHHYQLMTLRDKMIAHDDGMVGTSECFAAFDADFGCEHVVALTQRATVYSAMKPELARLPMCIDIVLTWLVNEKDKYCQIVNDEINKLKPKTRRKFPEPDFKRYVGLSDATERKMRKDDPHWEYDWSTGEKRLVSATKELKPKFNAMVRSLLDRVRSIWQ
jgi:hypothetical protein